MAVCRLAPGTLEPVSAASGLPTSEPRGCAVYERRTVADSEAAGADPAAPVFASAGICMLMRQRRERWPTIRRREEKAEEVT